MLPVSGKPAKVAEAVSKYRPVEEEEDDDAEPVRACSRTSQCMNAMDFETNVSTPDKRVCVPVQWFLDFSRKIPFCGEGIADKIEMQLDG